ncbi:MAG: hypothetical protein ACLQFW_14865 [Xanthobacteraceae bacterium]
MPICLAGLGKRRAKCSRKVLKGSLSQKRSPASAATERGTNRKSKSSQKQITKTARKSQAGERHFFYVTHGQINIGFVAQAGNEFAASDADGRKIGVFESLKAASDAISERCGGAL